MPTCKDCIHNKICGHYVKSLSKSKGIDFDNAIEQYCEKAECDNCEYFQNRSKFIELPCEIVCEVPNEKLNNSEKKRTMRKDELC